MVVDSGHDPCTGWLLAAKVGATESMRRGASQTQQLFEFRSSIFGRFFSGHQRDRRRTSSGSRMSQTGFPTAVARFWKSAGGDALAFTASI
jgi:hypothetical protein